MSIVKKSRNWIFLLAMILTYGVFGIAHMANARGSYENTYNSNYGANTTGCVLCHPNGNTSQFTAAGNAFGPSHNYAAIAPNPQMTQFSIPLTSTSLTVQITTFTATDNVYTPIKGYMATESATPPSYNATGWGTTAPRSYTFPVGTAPGPKILYAWVLDSVNKVGPSSAVSASTTVTLPPVLTTIAVAPATASIAAGATQQFTATARDQNGNLMSPQPAFTWSSSGTAVATINSSSGLATGVAAGSTGITATNGTVSGTASLTVKVVSPEPPPSIPGGADLSIWVGKWIKVSIQNRGYYSEEENRLSNDRQKLSAYLKITAWDPDNKILQATILGKGEDEEEKWSESILLRYISGTNLNFLCWSQMTLAGDATYGFTARIRGSMRKGNLAGGIFTSVGGYHVETPEENDNGDDDDDDEELSSKQSPAGWLKITGRLIAEAKVPADIRE